MPHRKAKSSARRSQTPKIWLSYRFLHNHILLKYLLSPPLHFSIPKTIITTGTEAGIPYSKLLTGVTPAPQSLGQPLPTPPSHSSGNFTASMPPHCQALTRVLEYTTPACPAFTQACCTIRYPLSSNQLSSETQLRCHLFPGATHESPE